MSINKTNVALLYLVLKFDNQSIVIVTNIKNNAIVADCIGSWKVIFDFIRV